MNNVVALNSRSSTPFSFGVNSRRTDPNFFLGVMVFLVLPQVVAIAYYGVLLAAMSGTFTLAGVGLGFAIYRYFPSRIQTLSLKTRTQTRSCIETITRKAA
jgi:hypothetical protein